MSYLCLFMDFFFFFLEKWDETLFIFPSFAILEGVQSQVNSIHISRGSVSYPLTPFYSLHHTASQQAGT